MAAHGGAVDSMEPAPWPVEVEALWCLIRWGVTLAEEAGLTPECFAHPKARDIARAVIVGMDPEDSEVLGDVVARFDGGRFAKYEDRDIAFVLLRHLVGPIRDKATRSTLAEALRWGANMLDAGAGHRAIWPTIVRVASEEGVVA